MLKKIIVVILVVALVAGAAGAYLFKTFSVDTAQTEEHNHEHIEQIAESSAIEVISGYVVVFVDEESQFVPGVSCNVCDETTCTMMISNENGMIELPGNAFPYEIQFLKVPDGFKLPEEPFVVDGSAQLVTCKLEKA